MLIPYNTDAPIYHFPYATIGLISTNVLMYFVTATIAMNDPSQDAALLDAEVRSVFWLADSPKINWLNLQFDRIMPTQWVTSAFMHMDIFHLLGNMIFLWGFGLVVEGKVGWARFLGIYLTICLLENSSVQLLMFFTSNTPGAALGASGAIYGLMAISVLWAPQNEMNCVLLWFPFVRLIELSIVLFGFIYIGLQLLFFGLHGFDMSSEALHIVGFIAGAGVGLVYLKQDWVDCEGWDLFTVYFADQKKRDRKRNRQRVDEQKEIARQEKEESDKALMQVLQSITSALDSKNATVALAVYHKYASQLQAGRKLPDEMLRRLVSALHRDQLWEQSIPLLVEMLRRDASQSSVGPRLRLAEILIHVSEKPKQGYEVLKKLPKELPDAQREKRNKLARAAKAKLAEGSYEVDVQDW